MIAGQFELVNIKLESKNVRETVVKVLNACDIPTNYIDKIPVIQERKSQFRSVFII